MKRNIFSGLVILLPLTITIAVFIFLVDLLTTPFLGNMEKLLQYLAGSYSLNIVSHATALVIISRGLILVLLFFFVVILGFLGNRIIFHWLVKTMHAILLKIPLINSIYKMCRDVIEALFSEKRKLFTRVVAIPFPSKESKAIGLITGIAPQELQNAHTSDAPQELLKTVFIPTSPHPISGFLLLCEEKHLKELNLSVEDAFKFLISCGIFNPDQNKPDRGNKPNDDTKKTKNNILPG